MASDFSVVAIVAAYNEADIITHVVGDLVDQGVQVYVLDDGSTDGTVAAIAPFLGHGLIAIEPLGAPGEGEAHVFEWKRILVRKAQLAAELDADWFIHHDADEFRESPWSHLRLKDAIQKVDALGYNAIDFKGLDFWPVHDRFRAGQDVRKVFTSYAESADYDRVQIRCWKKAGSVDLASSGGHDARFPGRKVFPIRFLLRHYPIRGQSHGERKVFAERQHRFVEPERAQGWHVQYDDVDQGTSFIRDPSTLSSYDPDAVRVDLTLRHRGVEELEASLAETRATAEALDASLTEAGARSAALEASLAEARSIIDDRDLDLEQHRVELARDRVDLEQHRVELARNRVDLEQHRAELARHRVELEQCCAELTRAHGELGARAAEAAALRNLGEERAVEAAGLRAQLAARTAEASGFREALRQRVEEVERLNAAVADHTRRIDEFHRSRTWRWTSPARTVFRLLGGS